MANIVIKDLEESRELDRQALASVRGGSWLRSILGDELTNIIYPGGVFNPYLTPIGGWNPYTNFGSLNAGFALVDSWPATDFISNNAYYYLGP